MAQSFLSGTCYDSTIHTKLKGASVENLTTHQGTTTSIKGEYYLEVKKADRIQFSFVGYQKKILEIVSSDESIYKDIFLKSTATKIRGYVIIKGQTEYQKDSLNRASIYKDVFDYSQEKSIRSPISTVYEKFSKKYKDLRKFQDQIKNTEEQKYIDSKYTPELTHAMTKLTDDTLAEFMNQYPMEIDFARAATPLELKMWIKSNYKEYLDNRKKLKPQGK
jgi:hypothetical protein